MSAHDHLNGLPTVRDARVVDAAQCLEATALSRSPLLRGDYASELKYLQDDVAALSAALATPPPQSLQAKVMAEVDRTPQLPSASSDADTRSLPLRRIVASAAASGPVSGSVPVPASARARPRSGASAPGAEAAPGSRRHRAPARATGRRGPGAAVVAGTLLAAVLTTGASLMFTAHQQDRAGAGNTGSLAVAEADQARRQALRLATDPKARRLTTAFAGGGRATLFIVGKQATLVITRRDDLPGGQVYQAWVVQPDGRVDAAGITGGPQPWALLLTAVHAGQKISLTAEPPGGSARPTTTPVAVIRL